MAVNDGEGAGYLFGLVLAGMGLVALVAGVGLIAFVLRARRGEDDFAARALPARGELVDIIWRRPRGFSRNQWVAYPLLRYWLPDDSVVVQESFESSSRPVAQKGSLVTVLYDRDDPSRVRIEGDFQHNLNLVGGLVMGVCFAAGGVVLLAGGLGLLLLV